MTVYRYELRRSAKSFLIWSFSVGALALMCMLLYPSLQSQVATISDSFSEMGGFTAAFGMDVLNLGTLMGFYGIECGTCLGLGGGLYAAFTASGLLSGEELGHTAEFLYTHPLSRVRILTEKFAAFLTQLLAFNGVWVLCALAGFTYAGEAPAWKAFWLFQLAQLFLQAEIGAVCFLLSAFAGRGALGGGIGVMAAFYTLSLWGNISEKVDFVRFLTPYWYADASRVLPDASIDGGLLALSLCIAAASFLAALLYYDRRDIGA